MSDPEPEHERGTDIVTIHYFRDPGDWVRYEQGRSVPIIELEAVVTYEGAQVVTIDLQEPNKDDHPNAPSN